MTHEATTDVGTLVLQAQAGDERAFARLWQRLGEPLRRYLARRGFRATDDLMQDIAARAWEKIGMYDASRSVFATWLYAVAKNIAIDEVRRSRWLRRTDPLYREGPGGEVYEVPLPCPLPRPDAVAADRDLYHRALAALELLRPKSRLAVRLRDVEGLTYDEIAARMALPLGSVKALIHHGRSLIAEIVEDGRPPYRDTPRVIPRAAERAPQVRVLVAPGAAVPVFLGGFPWRVWVVDLPEGQRRFKQPEVTV